MGAEPRIQGIIWEVVHDGLNVVVESSGTIAYQSSEVAFSTTTSGTVSYQSSEVAFALSAPDSGTISYQSSEVAFATTNTTGTIAYQSVEVAFLVPEQSGNISYQSVEVAFSMEGQGQLYGDISEVAWIYNYGIPFPPTPPTPSGRHCGVLVNPDFSINTYGLRTLSCERIKAPGVDQVPFRLAHKTDLGLRRIKKIQAIGAGDPALYGNLSEVAWIHVGS